jgi:hypothetical protein
MAIFTIELEVGFSDNGGRFRRMTEYEFTKWLIRNGAMKACDIAESLVDNAPPTIVVRVTGVKRGALLFWHSPLPAVMKSRLLAPLLRKGSGGTRFGERSYDSLREPDEFDSVEKFTYSCFGDLRSATLVALSVRTSLETSGAS